MGCGSAGGGEEGRAAVTSRVFFVIPAPAVFCRRYSVSLLENRIAKNFETGVSLPESNQRIVHLL